MSKGLGAGKKGLKLRHLETVMFSDGGVCHPRRLVDTGFAASAEGRSEEPGMLLKSTLAKCAVFQDPFSKVLGLGIAWLLVGWMEVSPCLFVFLADGDADLWGKGLWAHVILLRPRRRVSGVSLRVGTRSQVFVSTR
jgi:hypothetical protein